MEHHRQILGWLSHQEPLVSGLGGLQSNQPLLVADDPPEVPGDGGGELDGGGSLHVGAVGEDGEGEDPGGKLGRFLAGAETVMDQLGEVRGDQGWGLPGDRVQTDQGGVAGRVGGEGRDNPGHDGRQ